MNKKINRQIEEAMGIITPLVKRFALVKYGGGIIQMSGSIAGNTFARNRYGNYIRSRTKPVNPNSARQVRMRAFMAFFAEEWRETLTPAQREAWNTYAAAVAMQNKLGETIHITGFNHFIRSNTVIADIGGTEVDEGPSNLNLPAKDGTISCVASVATQAFTVTFDDTMDWTSEDDAYLYISFGQPQNVTRNFFAGPWRGSSNFPGNNAAPFTSPAVVASIFTLTLGQRADLKFRIVRADGRASGDFSTFTTVVA